jgi:hypothetical protein
MEFLTWLKEHVKNVETDVIAKWMKDGDLTHEQYQEMQAILLQRKRPVDSTPNLMGRSLRANKQK